MTVKLLTGRAGQPAGSQYTADAATEAALVANKEATFDLTGATIWNPAGATPTPAVPALTYAQAAALARLATPQGGAYLGNAFPKKLRAGTYGRKVASWGALQNSAGTAAIGTPASFGIPALPWVDNATNVLKLTQNGTASFGQQSPIEGSQTYMPRANTGTTFFPCGVWVYNPGGRTLNFQVSFYNIGAGKFIYYQGACDPGLGWQFITFSPNTGQNSGSWVGGTDAIQYVRVTQLDTGPVGAWTAGEVLYFGNVYVDVQSRPRFLLTFDDGYASQRYPSATMKVSGSASVSASATNTLTTAAPHALQVGEPLVFTSGAPTGLALNTVYWVKTVPSGTTFTLATDYTLATQVTGITDGAYTGVYQYGGSQDRSCQQIVESYGFRGTIFVVGAWIGSTGKYGYVSAGGTFLTGSDILAMWNEGWSVGSHSYTHPSNAENAGLRLLGPYGYYLSNTFDNLPAQYVTNWGITAGNGRRRVTAGTQASPSVFTTENAHQFTLNQPIVFTDIAPTGCTLGVTYYVASVPSGTTFTLATDQGTLASLVNNTTGAFSGTCNYRWPGSSNDDTAIYADVLAGAQAVAALGIPTGFKFFALPQGSWDPYVRSACMRAGLTWVRGIGSSGGNRTIAVGAPSGALGNASAKDSMGGWMLQGDAIQTDGSTTIPQIQSYVNEVITQGACGCNYHHTLSTSNLAALDALCYYLKIKRDAGQIDVLTADDLAKELGF